MTRIKKILDLLWEEYPKEFQEWMLEQALSYIFQINVEKLRKLKAQE